jgi:hypothetical protein
VVRIDLIAIEDTHISYSISLTMETRPIVLDITYLPRHTQRQGPFFFYNFVFLGCIILTVCLYIIFSA